VEGEARNEEESNKRSHSFPAPSNSPSKSNEKQRKNADTILRICLQKRPAESSIEAARNRAEAPLFPQRSKGCAVTRSSLTAAEEKKTHRSRGNSGGRGGKGSHLAPALRKLKDQRKKRVFR